VDARRRTLALVSLGVLAAAAAALVLRQVAGDGDPERPGAGCNGHVELCDRAYDDVAYAATHNSMSAASLRGWFFTYQPDGIVEQLDHGIRVLLVDSWYGRRTDRRGLVVTSGRWEQGLAEARATVGERVVDRALRARGAAGLSPQGPQRPYLCHAMCELGSTSWLDSLRDTRAWLDAHPREVVTMFVQDEVSTEDTAAVFEEAGLLPYVYTPEEQGAWPTLGEMVESGERLVVLMENHGGGQEYPWLLPGFEWVQETPYLFKDPSQLSCAPNRGDPDASLFLVNHWITDRRRSVARAEEINARDVLLPRLEQCEEERGLLPNFVAVDHYDRGDLLGAVDSLNGVS
jgi:hypothetical protein